MADPSASQTPDAIARKWLGEIEAAEKDPDRVRWINRCKAIAKHYREQQDDADPVAPRRKKRMALLWANTQTLSPAVYARTPQAVVSRRFKDEDPVGRICSEILERALNFAIEESPFAIGMLGCRDEYLLYARGQMWVRYVPTIAPAPTLPQAPGSTQPGSPMAQLTAQPTAPEPPQVQTADDPEPYETVLWEEAVPDRLHHEDFLHNTARSWEEVRWVARRAFLTRDELIKRFGEEIGKQVPLDWSPETGKSATEKSTQDEELKKAAIYEIWDLATKQVIWVSKGYSQSPLDVRPDPLKLKDFFPCPRPMLGTLSPNSLIPVPDYIYWQDQADEVNVLTARIDKLIDALRVRGLYSAADKGKIESLLSADDNALIPVDSWAALGDKGGLKGIVEWLPLDLIASALKTCIEIRTKVIDDIYQITGISDIQRGDTDPDETATAQTLKSNWGSSRVRERQKEIARFARDVLRIMGDVISNKFGADVLSRMTGVKLLTAQQKAQVQQLIQTAQTMAQQAAQQAQAMGQPPPPPVPPPIPPEVLALLDLPTWDDVMAVLRDPQTRAFRVDIETDSTIEPNDQEEKQRRVEFVTAVGKYLSESLPVVSQAPQVMPVIAEGLKYLVRGFRAGREMEDTIDKALDQMVKASAQPQPPQADPKAQAEQAKAQAAQAQAHAAQTSAQAHIMQAQNDAQANNIEMAKVQSNHALGVADVQAENARTQAEQSVAIHEAVMKAFDRQAGRQAVSTAPILAPTR